MLRVRAAFLTLALAYLPAFSVQAASEPSQVLGASRVWASLPAPFLDALSAKLVSGQNAVDFLRIADRSGITAQLQIYDLKNPLHGITEMAIGLSGYGYRLAKAGDLSGARKTWALTLMLVPRHVSTWVGMAILSVNEQDCRAAVSWADKVLTFKADEFSADPNEIISARLMNGEGEVETGTVDNTRAMLDQMREIKDMCKDAYR